ncbi:hypothetical protein D3C75_1313090 [compost metagenome]
MGQLCQGMREDGVASVIKMSKIIRVHPVVDDHTVITHIFRLTKELSIVVVILEGIALASVIKP